MFPQRLNRQVFRKFGTARRRALAEGRENDARFAARHGSH